MAITPAQRFTETFYAAISRQLGIAERVSSLDRYWTACGYDYRRSALIRLARKLRDADAVFEQGLAAAIPNYPMTALDPSVEDFRQANMKVIAIHHPGTVNMFDALAQFFREIMGG